MRRLVILSLAMVFVFALSRPAAADADSTLEKNKAVVRQVYEVVFNAGKLDAIERFVTADAIDHEVGLGQKDPVPAVDSLKGLVTEMRKAFPDLKMQVEDMVAEGDKVIARVRMTGTQKGEFMGAPATGKSISVEVFDMLRLVDGKIVEHWGLSDDTRMMQQLGLTPLPPLQGGGK